MIVCPLVRSGTTAPMCRKTRVTRMDMIISFDAMDDHATASRDLKTGVEKGLLVRAGDKRTAVYRFPLKVPR